MFQDEVISNRLKLFFISWTILLTALIIYYSLQLTSFQVFSNIWQTMMLLHSFLSWLTIFLYTLLFCITNPSLKLLQSLKIFFLSLSGPYLLITSFYAFYSEENLHVNIYALSFLIWWLVFTISIYSLFKLTLEVSLTLQRRSRRRRLTAHYKMVDMKSVV